jgi:hypothetical protein
MRDDISLVASDVSGEFRAHLDEYDGDEVGDAAAAGAAGGAVVGGLTGLLIGLGALAIPGVGPIVAAGPVLASLTGAGIGAATGGLLGALVEWGIPESEAGYYTEAVRRGGTMVAVRADEQRVNEVTGILNTYNPVDIEQRADFWRSEYGWTGYDANAEPMTVAEVNDYRSQLVDSDWDEEWDDDEEMPAWADLEMRYRRDFDSRYARAGHTWETYSPAYLYGYSLGGDPRFAAAGSWADIEPDARVGWEQQNEGAWQDFKESVRYGWEQVKDAMGAGSYRAGVEDPEDEWAHRSR